MATQRHIDLELLRTFLAVIETGSFARAADAMGRTQSAISMQIQRLEDHFQHKLFDRARGSLPQLTAYGSLLVDRAPEILLLNDTLWTELAGSEPDEAGQRTLEMTPHRAQREAFTHQVMMTLLTNEKFSAAYSGVMGHVAHQTTVDPERLTDDEDDGYMALLSMVEYIAINFLSNAMDRTIVLRQRRSGLKRMYEVLVRYIDHKRAIWRRPNAYRSFETLAREYL